MRDANIMSCDFLLFKEIWYILTKISLGGFGHGFRD